MTGSYSNVMRFTGMSGIDTESMVKQMMKAEGMKLDRLKVRRELTSWRQTAYRESADKLSKFQNQFLSFSNPATNLRSQAAFASKIIEVKKGGNETGEIAISASSKAANGTYTVKVKQLATGEAFEGARILDGKLDMDGTMEQLGTGVANESYVFQGNGKRITISANANTSISDFVKQVNKALNDTGSNASFGYNATTGKFSMTANGTGEIDGRVNKDIFVGRTFDNLMFRFKMTASSDNHSGYQLPSTFNINGNMSQLGISSNLPKTFTFDVNGTKVNVTAAHNTTVNSFLTNINQQLNASGANAKVAYNSTTNSFSITADTGGRLINKKAFEGLYGFNDLADIFKVNRLADSTAKDSIIEIKTPGDSTPTTIKNGSNRFTLGEINFTLNEATNTEIKVDMRTDTDKTFETIKTFVNAYNEMIAALNKETGTARPRSGYNYYDPLTEEQKSAMKESDIKAWEEKAKTGLLHRDSIIDGITSQMRSFLYQSVDTPTGKISLMNLGITTTKEYKDKGKLQIDEEKLRKAIDADPDAVMELFTKSSDYTYFDKENKSKRMASQGLSERLNDIITDAIGSTGSITEKAGLKDHALSDLQSVISKDLRSQDKRINDMIRYLAKKENHYYEMFSRMEQAINQSNSQMSSLMSSLGQ